MNKIPSFTINHNKLLRGIYVSRKDEVGGEVITTFDIRMKVPNQEPCLAQRCHPYHRAPGCHLTCATTRSGRTASSIGDQWDALPATTSSSRGDLESKDIVELMKRTFQFIADFEGEIPGQAAKDCGNYLLHDLPMAKYESKKYLEEVLNCITRKQT